MLILVRALGVLLVLLAFVGALAACAAQGMQLSVPVLETAEWTGPLRANVDFAIYALLGWGGVLLARLRPARLVLTLALLLSAARLAFDLAAADRTTARGQTILKGDVFVLVVAALALGLALGLALVATRRGAGRISAP